MFTTVEEAECVLWLAELKSECTTSFPNGQELTVTRNTNLDILRNYAVPQLPPETVFQQDGGKPPQNANHVRAFLDDTSPDCWIGRGGPMSWPPWSPDRTPLDSFLWGFVKDEVYRTPVTVIAELRGRIYEAIGLVTLEMLSRLWQEIEYRLVIARATNGAHIELVRDTGSVIPTFRNQSRQRPDEIVDREEDILNLIAKTRDEADA
ncbi:hypothetical protein ANN_22174 [Periplaneta americana]|uniref:Restriction endonuclease domain-containing protein n=1 Tax=Periplaneta americana TaxID=6978 RepID=A0ABQ8S7K8_PERAM|nr:hypothetical protein ANN_22174 [Periplaneta americana]